RMNLRNLRRGVEALGHVPWLPQGARLRLQVTPRQVIADCVAVNMCQRSACGNLYATTMQCNDQFDLVMQVLGAGWIRDARAAGNKCIRGLGEEDRRFTSGVSAHLTHMVGIVASH